MALSVLVVDDSTVMRTMIIRTLRLSGLEVSEIHQAENGRKALDVLGEQWIDLAFVDINMPVMDGIEMIETVRKMPEIADLPIIVVSTECSTTRIDMLRRQGVGFVHKPFSAEMLRETVVKMTGIPNDGPSSAGTFKGGARDF